MSSQHQSQNNSLAARVEAQIEAALSDASLEEKVAMMSGHGFFAAFVEDDRVWGARPYRAGGGCERLELPFFGFSDGPRGVARGESTCFPVAMARGASFDTDLEYRIGEAMSLELRAQDCNLSGAVCVNLLRHPAWGRAQETYGEDSHHLGEMGAALAAGLQVHNVAATVKHFALNSIENSRFYVDVRVSQRVLHELYLPHFKRIIDAGCQTVMSAYNKLNGEYCGQNRELLTDILRKDWGFKGVVHSDWIMGVYQPYGAEAGLDIENPEPVHFGQKLVDAVNDGHISPRVIDQACARIMRVLWTNQQAEDPRDHYPLSLVACEAHRQLALEAAQKSAVLLKNTHTLLPLQAIRKIAVLGQLAVVKNTGDKGSSRVRAPYVVTPLAGLQERFGESNVHFAGSESNLDTAVHNIGDVDLVLIVAGYTADEEGEYIPGDINLGQEAPSADELDARAEAAGDADTQEDTKPQHTQSARGGDRIDLGLPAAQIALIKACTARHNNVLVVIQAGSAVLVDDWIDDAAGLLHVFYAGMEGGKALAQIIAGDVNPSGHLPFTVARKAEDYPFFDREAAVMEYDLWHGYGKFQAQNLQPRFPFGFGLSYTQFEYRALKARTDSRGDITVQVSVRNTGQVAGASVVQVYISPPNAVVKRWPRLLKAFQRVELAANEQQTVHLSIRRESLDYWDEKPGSWRFEAGRYAIEVGQSSDPDTLISCELEL
ncbi:MAG: glycoside hydrolase family 3 C-terminal domain-containing protein [Halieaceae bacterium]|uniref:beta-glucosidase family protein n=1 Tax=Haliea alexandrii TaxID=2448162 RepID=UPI000F0BB17A|nr:glycoside hydrolase family 3 C-terminal domain-containing protein [Haliea alexandrii]MCR9184033.1 glycoside hydrolase family 3 C-terminal domain-containing protein [Halieaceae bacterium]